MSGLKILLPMAAVIVGIFGVLLVILKITGTGGGNGIVATPTASPINSGFLTPMPTPAVWKTVTPQDAASVGRTDCPPSWVAYTDPQGRFSICFPPGSAVTASDFAVNIHSPASPGQKLDLISLAVGWDTSPGTIYYPPNPENCDKYPVEGHISSSFVELTLSGSQVPACLSRGVLEGIPAVPVASLQGAVPLAKGNSDREGFITFALNFTSSDLANLPALGNEIIQTLSVNFR
jgi:hypothetical protein